MKLGEVSPISVGSEEIHCMQEKVKSEQPITMEARADQFDRGLVFLE